MVQQVTILQHQLPILFKILDGDGKSFHGGNMEWSLPSVTRSKVTPGDWHEIEGDVDICRRGLHLTDQEHISNWSGNHGSFGRYESDPRRVFLAEPGSDGVVQDYYGGQSPTGSYDKYAVSRARLLEEIPSPVVDLLTTNSSLDGATMKAERDASLAYLRKNHARAVKALWRMLPTDEMSATELRALRRYLKNPTSAGELDRRNEAERTYFTAREEYLKAWGREETEAEAMERRLAERIGRLTVTFVNCVTGTPDRLIGALQRHGKQAGQTLVHGHDRAVRTAGREAEANWKDRMSEFDAILARHGLSR